METPENTAALPVKAHRLPIWHPEYRYPGSTNPYSLKLQELQDRVYSDNLTERHAGNWRNSIPDTLKNAAQGTATRELHVEIGCNCGHVVVEWAARNPQHAYIGLDWKFKPIFRAAEKTVKRGIDNALFFRAHAERLEYMFGPGEIDRLYLFFPDPWPKKAHWKNRFVTADQLCRILKVMKHGGIFHIKTDHPGYFEWIENALADALKTLEAKGSTENTPTWKIVERSANLHKDHPNPKLLQIPEVTLFERLFIKDGIPIHSLKLQRI